MKKFISLMLILLCALSFAACSGKAQESYSLGNADRARVFYNTYNSYVGKYGEGKDAEGSLTGAAIVRLMDFTGDGNPEMLIAYSSEKDGKVDSVMVCGFDMGYAELLNEKITSKSSASAEGNCLWLYTDSSGLSYIVMGEDLSLSRSYTCYQQAGADGKALYKFAEAFTADGMDLSGTYEKIELSGNSDTNKVFKTNKNVVAALESQKN